MVVNGKQFIYPEGFPSKQLSDYVTPSRIR